MPHRYILCRIATCYGLLLHDMVMATCYDALLDAMAMAYGVTYSVYVYI